MAIGDLTGTILTFEHAGDVLPMHEHGERDIHISVVARGRFRVHGPTIGTTEVSAGAVLDFMPGHPHEFIALEDGSRVVQIQKRVNRPG